MATNATPTYALIRIAAEEFLVLFIKKTLSVKKAITITIYTKVTFLCTCELDASSLSHSKLTLSKCFSKVC